MFPQQPACNDGANSETPPKMFVVVDSCDQLLVKLCRGYLETIGEVRALSSERKCTQMVKDVIQQKLYSLAKFIVILSGTQKLKRKVLVKDYIWQGRFAALGMTCIDFQSLGTEIGLPLDVSAQLGFCYLKTEGHLSWPLEMFIRSPGLSKSDQKWTAPFFATILEKLKKEPRPEPVTFIMEVLFTRRLSEIFDDSMAAAFQEAVTKVEVPQEAYIWLKRHIGSNESMFTPLDAPEKILQVFLDVKLIPWSYCLNIANAARLQLHEGKESVPERGLSLLAVITLPTSDLGHLEITDLSETTDFQNVASDVVLELEENFVERSPSCSTAKETPLVLANLSMHAPTSEDANVVANESTVTSKEGEYAAIQAEGNDVSAAASLPRRKSANLLPTKTRHINIPSDDDAEGNNMLDSDLESEDENADHGMISSNSTTASKSDDVELAQAEQSCDFSMGQVSTKINGTDRTGVLDAQVVKDKGESNSLKTARLSKVDQVLLREPSVVVERLNIAEIMTHELKESKGKEEGVPPGKEADSKTIQNSMVESGKISLIQRNREKSKKHSAESERKRASPSGNFDADVSESQSAAQVVETAKEVRAARIMPLAADAKRTESTRFLSPEISFDKYEFSKIAQSGLRSYTGKFPDVASNDTSEDRPNDETMTCVAAVTWEENDFALEEAVASQQSETAFEQGVGEKNLPKRVTRSAAASKTVNSTEELCPDRACEKPARDIAVKGPLATAESDSRGNEFCEESGTVDIKLVKKKRLRTSSVYDATKASDVSARMELRRTRKSMSDAITREPIPLNTRVLRSAQANRSWSLKAFENEQGEESLLSSDVNMVPADVGKRSRASSTSSVTSAVAPAFRDFLCIEEESEPDSDHDVALRAPSVEPVSNRNNASRGRLRKVDEFKDQQNADNLSMSSSVVSVPAGVGRRSRRASASSTAHEVATVSRDSSSIQKEDKNDGDHGITVAVVSAEPMNGQESVQGEPTGSKNGKRPRLSSTTRNNTGSSHSGKRTTTEPGTTAKATTRPEEKQALVRYSLRSRAAV